MDEATQHVWRCANSLLHQSPSTSRWLMLTSWERSVDAAMVEAACGCGRIWTEELCVCGKRRKRRVKREKKEKKEKEKEREGKVKRSRRRGKDSLRKMLQPKQITRKLDLMDLMS